MSFRNLTDAECGRVNPILQLTSHLTSDRTFRESHGYNQPFTSESDQLVEQFLQETRAIPQTFHMDGLLQEMREIESQRFAAPPVPASRVKDHLNDDTWALQYLEDGKRFHDTSVHEEIWTELSGHPHDDSHELGLSENWARDYVEHVNQVSEAEHIQQTANEIVHNVDDPKFAYSKFMKFMHQVGEGKVVIEDGNVVTKELDETADKWAEEFASNNKSDELLEEWTARDKTADGYSDDIWSKYQDEWQKLSDPSLQSEHPWVSEFSDLYDPYKEYSFSDNNPMAGLKNALEIGKKKLAEEDLPSAVLCFEEAVKQNPTDAECWQYLGTTQAENEQDPNAICALKKCLEIDPSNLTALMALAVCYTNENYQNQACQTLINWLKNNPKYQDIVPPNYNNSQSIPSFLSEQQHKEVQELFIKAAQRNTSDIDHNIQCGLGVLFNLSGDYDKAVDCFRAALNVVPEDARIWNRLGATLANSSRPIEAVDAYHHALQISPGFIRARYNVGITCINLGAHKEAAEHFLTALNQQAQGRDVSNLKSHSQMSDTIWSTFRMCVGLMNRSDLKSFIDTRDLSELNKAFDMSDV